MRQATIRVRIRLQAIDAPILLIHPTQKCPYETPAIMFSTGEETPIKARRLGRRV